MATRHEMFHGPEGESQPKIFHEELHAPYPEERDSGVNAWYLRKETLAAIDADELAVVEDELASIPEVVEYEKEPVTIEAIGELASLAHELVPEKQQLSFAPAEMEFREMFVELNTLIDQYGQAVRRFQGTKLASFHLDTDKYQAMMRNIDQTRRNVHEALVSHIHAFSRFLHQRLPKMAGPGFNHEGWEQYLKDDWFDLDRIKDRRWLGDWALRTDIVEKAKAVQSAIRSTLEKKNAGIDETNARAVSSP